MCQGTKSSNLWFSTQSKNAINNFLNANSSSLVYINGPANIYYTGNKGTYYIHNAPPGTVTWTITGPFTLSPASGSTTNVTQTAASGTGTLTAKINGTVVATKSITASSPVLGPMTGPDVVYRGQTYISYRLNSVQGLTYTWGCNGDLELVSGNGYSEGLFDVVSNPINGYGEVFCTVSVNGVIVDVYYKPVSIY
jgi:hypothetical protein